MGKRIHIYGPGDSPDEYWFECDDCEGTGQASITLQEAAEGIGENGPIDCGNCDGSGHYAGDEDDAKMMGRDRFPDVDWFCDRCHTHLNSQLGFDDFEDIWKCTNCGYRNSISLEGIINLEQ